MFTVTHGTYFSDFMSWVDALWQAELWSADYPDEEIVIYDVNDNPVKIWINGKELF